MVEIKADTATNSTTEIKLEQGDVQIKQEIDDVAENTEECKKDESKFNVGELLQMKIKLSDDTEAPLFSYGPKIGEEKSRTLNCHLCRIGNIKDEAKKGHIESQLHKKNLGMQRRKNAERYNNPYRQFCGVNEEGKVMQFEIRPGENIEEITDEYKDRVIIRESQYVRPKPEYLKVLKEEKLHEYNQKMPLLGLGYIFKMKSGDQILYHCALCGMKVKGETFQHVAGSTHQASYIIKHFPDLYAKVKDGLGSIRNEVAAEQCIRNIFRYLYRKIENSHRRPKVHLIDFEYFQKNRESVLSKCQEEHHFDEKLLKIRQKELDTLIDKCLKGIEFIKPDLRSLAKPDLGVRAMIPIVLRNSGPMDRDDLPNKKRRRDFGERPPENYAAYRLMLGNQLEEINGMYKMYEINPRAHPQYNQEWQRFWHERCRQLKKDKIDPRYHDFESEWAPYWIQRLRQFYGKDLIIRKRELKKIFNLPFDRSPSPLRQMDQQMQQEPMQWQPQPQPPQPMFGAPITNQGRPMPIFTEDTPIVSSEPLSVISVMRLLSALEDQLGSLGPKAVQLLSRAVLCEKDSGNTDELLLDNDYYVFFATVKEKFRGQLLANLIDPLKVKAVSHCVNEISAILEVMESALGKERERQRKEQEKLKQHQQQQQRLQQQKAQSQSLMNTYSSDNSRAMGRDQFGSNRGGDGSFGGGFVGHSGMGSNQPAGGNQDYTRGRNRFARKRNAADNTATGGGKGSNWISGGVFTGGDNNPRQNYLGTNDNSGRNFNHGDNSSRNFGRGNSNMGGSFGSGNDNSGRNFSGAADSGRNFSGGNDSGRSYGGVNDSGRNFDTGNDSGRNFNSGNMLTKRYSGGNDSGRNFGSGNENRPFTSGGGGGASGGNNTNRNYNSSSLNTRNDNANYPRNNYTTGFDSKNDNFNKNFGDGNGRWNSNFGSSSTDTGRGFNTSNTDNLNRNLSSGSKDNFGKNYSGGGSNNYNTGRNFGGNNNFSSSRGNFGNNSANRFDGGNNSSRDMGGQLYSRRSEDNFDDKDFNSGNVGGGGGGGNFGMGQSNNYNRLGGGFNNNY